MRFYGHGIVWDTERNRVLCKFDRDGTFETQDHRAVGILSGMGYKYEPEPVKKPELEIELEPTQEKKPASKPRKKVK